MVGFPVRPANPELRIRVPRYFAQATVLGYSTEELDVGAMILQGSFSAV
jgi:hypothetical protein